MENAGARDRPQWAHLVSAGLFGVTLGAWWVRNQIETAKRSRAEQEDPDGVSELCEEIGQVLDGWEPSEDCEDEDDFREDLADYLESNTEREIDVVPGTTEGRPDILVDDLVALELKVDLSKAERDRCIGQCMSYSREWATWIILIDTPLNKVRVLEDLLKDKGLNHILVWSFA